MPSTIEKPALVRPRRRGLPTSPDQARAQLDAAQKQHEHAVAQINEAIHTRAKTAYDAHRAGLTWEEIGARLGDMNHSTALKLAGRYKTAADEGRRLKLGGK